MRASVRAVAVAAAAIALVVAPAAAQSKKLIFWTHWEQNPEFNKYYETRGKDFAQKSGYEVQVVTVPYQGYEAKYLAALMGKSGGPDIFMGMTHHWAVSTIRDKMPADLAKIWDDNLPKYIVNVGKWKGARYGVPLEHGNFQQMYINVDLFKKAGLDPDKPPKTLDDWLAAMKKLTVLDAKGEPTQVGFALRHKGHPVGITDKFLPFAHAFGARMLSPNLEKATGFANSPEMVAALQFYGDLVNKDKVASIAFPTPEDAFGQKRAATIFRESWFFGWVKKNAPDLAFKVYALPCGKACPGAARCFVDDTWSRRTAPTSRRRGTTCASSATPRTTSTSTQAQGILPVWTRQSRFAVRQGAPGLRLDAGELTAGARRVLPSEVQRARDRLRRGTSSLPCTARASRSRCWTKRPPRGSDPQRLGCRPRTYDASGGGNAVRPAAVVYFGLVFLVPLVESVVGSFYRQVPAA